MQKIKNTTIYKLTFTIVIYNIYYNIIRLSSIGEMTFAILEEKTRVLYRLQKKTRTQVQTA
jgi:hypothetical protein